MCYYLHPRGKIMDKLVILCCISMLVFPHTLYARTLEEAKEIAEETRPVPPDAEERRKMHDDIRRLSEENLMLQKIKDEIKTPVTGVEEVLRQEKIKLLNERINDNVSKADAIRKDQMKQTEMIQQQQKILNQHRNLPKTK